MLFFFFFFLTRSAAWIPPKHLRLSPAPLLVWFCSDWRSALLWAETQKSSWKHSAKPVAVLGFAIPPPPPFFFSSVNICVYIWEADASSWMVFVTCWERAACSDKVYSVSLGPPSFSFTWTRILFEPHCPQVFFPSPQVLPLHSPKARKSHYKSHRQWSRQTTRVPVFEHCSDTFVPKQSHFTTRGWVFESCWPETARMYKTK